MKLNNLLLSLVLVATGSVMVACGSGGSSNNAPASPVVTPIELPAGFVAPAGSTSGIGYNVSNAQIAVPAKGNYNIIQLTSEQALSVAKAIESGGVISQQANGELVIAAPASATNPTTTAESAVIIVPQTNSTQSKSLQTATSALTYTISIPAGRTTTCQSNEFKTTSGHLIWAVWGDDYGITIYEAETYRAARIPSDSTQCPGIPSAISLGENNGSDYIAWGTQGVNGKVCVVDFVSALTETQKITNLTSQAPAANDHHGNGYQGGVVNYLGFANTQSTGQIVGFWNVSNQIYKVIGNSTNGGVTPVGFLNTTSGTANQKSSAAATGVTFSGFPTPSAIYSTYVDNASNVWVGTNTGKVYVLRAGVTQWTNSTPSKFANALTANVTVSPQNGQNSGITATIPNAGGAISVSIN